MSFGFAAYRFARAATALFVGASLTFLPLAPALAKAPPKQKVVLQAGAVAVADRYGAAAAYQILQEGGNAVDAAVAVGFALAVTYPEAGNLGGGGFMTLYVAGKPYFLDYRERAPLAAQRDMYLDAKGQIIKNMSLIGYRAVAVPGTVAGMWEAQHRFGKLKWKQVLAPAIRYATEGFIVDDSLQQRREAAAKDFAGKTNFDDYFSGLVSGATFKQPELAATLQRLADDGPDDFYNGRTASLLTDAMRGHGLITADDLAQYHAVWRAPILADWDGYQVITAPPPSSGGIGLVQMLKMKADLSKDFQGVPLNSAHYVHLIAEIEKRVFADRAEYLGDPDFYQVPIAKLTDDAYLASRAAEVNPDKPSDTASVKPGLGDDLPEKPETTHYSIVDKWGNAVSNTYTLNGYFGAGEVVTGAGFVLNDEMDDFSAKPGAPNLFGVVGGNANEIAAGKRPLSSMAPTILVKDGKPVVVIGTPGGSRIFTTIFQVLTDWHDFHLPFDQAVAAMRFHHQLLPANTIYWEPYAPIDGPLAKQLEALGYTLAKQSFSGDVQAIVINGDMPQPVSDPRGRGVARVVP